MPNACSTAPSPPIIVPIAMCVSYAHNTACNAHHTNNAMHATHHTIYIMIMIIIVYVYKYAQLPHTHSAHSACHANSHAFNAHH